jgi:putative transposase
LVEDLNTADGVAVKLSCRTLKLSRSGFYDWTKRPESNRQRANREILPRVISIHEASKETYGSPRITAQLRSEGFLVNEKRIAKLMHDNEIASVINPRFKVQTTDSSHDRPVAPRLFETEFASDVMAPDQVYVGDITYIQTDEGFLFLAVFMDIFTRKIVGHSSDETMTTELILSALGMSLGRQNVVRDQLIAHSDRGSQYASEKFSKTLDDLGIVASMSRKGNCWDNAHVESFFHTLKTELVYRKKFKTREEAKRAIFDWIETWYNSSRLHSAIDYMAPNDYEKLAKAA